MTLILSGTDGLSDIDGSAATPAVRGTDTNTGIFFGADIIGFAEGGAEVARFDSSGNLLVGTTSAATPSTTGYISVANTFGFKNRLINSAMVIDQRNAGASVSIPSSSSYTVDRWQGQASVSSKFSVQQNAGSVTPPAGFKNYLGVTSSSAYSIGASDYFFIQQIIEGYNIADLAWGTANAQTITISFWVRSSLTGTFGGCLENSGASYNYPFTYTISNANTWEQKSITITGATSGTWLTTNGAGIYVIFGLGIGSTYSFSAGSWTTSVALGATGATSVVGTNGATFYITGVQLEKGSTATSFDYRPFGTELALCQRYLYKVDGTDGLSSVGAGMSISTTEGRIAVQYPVKMRASPTASIAGTMYLLNTSGAGTTVTSIAANYGGAQGAMIAFGVASGLTVGAGNLLVTNTGAGNYFQASAEL